MSTLAATPPATGAPAPKRLVVAGLSVDFGGLRALDGVSLAADQREVLGVIGPNGAGKTTLFNVICGFVRPRAGTIAYGGTPLAGRRPHELNRLGIARTMQGVGLCRAMTARENVMLGARPQLRGDFASALLGLRRSSREERRIEQRANDLLDRFGIASYAGQPAASLPYGIQKQVALARALLAEPSLLLLDEPASGLSEEEMGGLASVIHELSSEIGVVLVEHRMDLVYAVCSRVAVLDFGQVIADGTPQQIRDDPEVATAYLGRDLEPGVASRAATTGDA